jgi:hypothetical protein
MQDHAPTISKEQALFIEMLVNGVSLPVVIAELDLTAEVLSEWLVSSKRFAYLVKISQSDLDQTELKLINIELTLARSRPNL